MTSPGRRDTCARESSVTPYARTGATSLRWPGIFGAAWDALRTPTVVLRAPRGMFGQVPGLIGDEVIAEAARRRPDIPIETVADANHYTIGFADRFAARIAHHIEAGSS